MCTSEMSEISMGKCKVVGSKLLLNDKKAAGRQFVSGDFYSAL